MTVDVTGDLAAIDRLSSERDIAVGLAVKQCLVNVLRHAQVARAEVAVIGSESDVSVMVIDAGRGFSEQQVASDRLGLRQSVRRRIESVNGEVRLWSTPGRGTSVLDPCARRPDCGCRQWLSRSCRTSSSTRWAATASRPITLVLSLGIVAVAAGATLLGLADRRGPGRRAPGDRRDGRIRPRCRLLVEPAAGTVSLGGFPGRHRVRRLRTGAVRRFATWGRTVDLVQDWAPIAVGLILVQLSSYRPARELIATTMLGGILAAFLVVIRPETTGSALPPLVTVLDAALPIVALGAGATAYSSVVSRSLRQWYARSGCDPSVRSARR